ncbi:hypothetical protein [Microcoleus sp. CAWBG58]|uniref:hypothetical protein n=1 Tax=Microcoleus sp. CAWBG58 TaxID=2841651 RepID=UPI0025FE01C0|nr:hypothetical protein [Microcoleus sp. CAWBG58]
MWRRSGNLGKEFLVRAIVFSSIGLIWVGWGDRQPRIAARASVDGGGWLGDRVSDYYGKYLWRLGGGDRFLRS